MVVGLFSWSGGYIMKHRSTTALHPFERASYKVKTEKAVLQVALQSGSEPLEGLNDGDEQIMAIWANKGMSVVTTTYFAPVLYIIVY
jgi:hypothetical protein